MKVDFFNLHAQHEIIKEKIDIGISRVLEHKKFILGPEVQQLESELKSYLDVNSCITVANGTEAMNNKRAAAPKKVKCLCKNFVFTAGMLESVLPEGRMKR